MAEIEEKNMGILATFRALRNISGWALWGTASLMFFYLHSFLFVGIAIPGAAETTIYLTNGALMTVGTLNILNDKVHRRRERLRRDNAYRKLRRLSEADKAALVKMANVGQTIAAGDNMRKVVLSSLAEMGIYKVSDQARGDDDMPIFVLTDLGNEVLLGRFLPWYAERDENLKARMREALDRVIIAVKEHGDGEDAENEFDGVISTIKFYYGPGKYR